MKKFVISIFLFIISALLITAHSLVLLNFGKKIEILSEQTLSYAYADNWKMVEKNLETIDDEWSKKRFWAAITIKTNVIEEIDISLKQSIAMAKLKEKPDFLSEFIMLERLLLHIPHQEGFHIEELL